MIMNNQCTRGYPSSTPGARTTLSGPRNYQLSKPHCDKVVGFGKWSSCSAASEQQASSKQAASQNLVLKPMIFGAMKDTGPYQNRPDFDPTSQMAIYKVLPKASPAFSLIARNK
jgi:hypothetical protein